MATTIETPRQYSQPSRKGKRAWRKNIDISEVQQGLDDVREEVIRGGVIAEKPSDELFAFDTSGDKGIQRAYQKTHKHLKADEILAQRSAVPALDTHKRASKTTDGIIEPAAKRQRSGKISYKELERLRNVAHGRLDETDVVKVPENAEYDPWDREIAMRSQPKDPKFSFLESAKPIREPSTLKQAPISLAADGRKIPAIKPPPVEASYNPDSAAYFAAFAREGEKEVDAERKRLREAEQEKERLEKIAAAMEESDHEGSEDDDEESAWEGIQSEPEDPDWLNRRRPERKTQAQRNKIKRRKELERKSLSEEKTRKRMEQVGHAKAIAKAIDAKNKNDKMSLLVEDLTSESQDGDDTQLRRRRLGRYFPPQAPLELVLPSELQESLRLLKPEGNLLGDRFRNMIVRGKVEARRPIQRGKKRNRTYTEKWSYKDWKLK
ncbi:MAG: Glioma tumor suppressor candidate region protein 2 [Chaenotheca gracillima]|nr:MAG: Glioma tumor suppressor candidate region protein 2 [Chaenotheca gracillima]